MRSSNNDLSERSIRQMVEMFYASVRLDPDLGSVFEKQISGDWPAHLDRMVDFWVSALLRVRRYSGNPRSVHSAIVGIRDEHFDRWLELFQECVNEIFLPEVAEEIYRRAQAMGRTFRSVLPENLPPGLPLLP